MPLIKLDEKIDDYLKAMIKANKPNYERVLKQNFCRGGQSVKSGKDPVFGAPFSGPIVWKKIQLAGKMSEERVFFSSGGFLRI